MLKNPVSDHKSEEGAKKMERKPEGVYCEPKEKTELCTEIRLG